MGGKLGSIGSIGGGIAGGVFGGPAGAAIGSQVGGALGGIADGDPNKKAKQAQMDALKRQEQAYLNQIFLNPEDYVVDYEKVNADELAYYRPELEVAEQLGDTELAKIQLDPAYKQAQMQALARLNQRAEQGLTVEEEAARNNIMRNLEASNRGAQEAVVQSMARRGQLGSGTELAARMGASQGEYSEAARQAENLISERNKRALQAALESGNLAGNLRQQEYGEKTDLAKARDAMAEFNLRQRAGVQQRNVGEKNVAGKSAADLRNDAYYKNLGMTNTQAQQRVAGLKDTTAARNTANLNAVGAAVDTSRTGLEHSMDNAQRKTGQTSALANSVSGLFGAYDKYKKDQRAESDARVKAGIDTEEDWK